MYFYDLFKNIVDVPILCVQGFLKNFLFLGKKFFLVERSVKKIFLLKKKKLFFLPIFLKET